MKAPNFTEKDIAKRVIEFLEDQEWDVFQEVRFNVSNSIHDIVAIKNKKIIWIIECKKSFGLRVISQAFYAPAHYRSVAVPQLTFGNDTKSYQYGEKLCRQEGIGIITLSSYKSFTNEFSLNFEIKRKAHYQRLPLKESESLIAQLKPEHKVWAEAGTKGGGHYTDYKYTILHVKDFIKDNPGKNIKEIILAVKGIHHYTGINPQHSLALALERYEGDWCRIERFGKQKRYFMKEEVIA